MRSSLIIGVALGAMIYGYMPGDWVLKIAGHDNPFAIPVAAIIGVPLYIRAETAIPIGVALMGKGMSIGAVIALVIGGAGMAIPEISMLASIFKKELVAMIVAVIFYSSPSINPPIIPVFCNIANHLRCEAMFYFIKRLSASILTSPSVRNSRLVLSSFACFSRLSPFCPPKLHVGLIFNDFNR